jgi:hypothetical protein
VIECPATAGYSSHAGNFPSFFTAHGFIYGGKPASVIHRKFGNMARTTNFHE